MTLTTKTDLAGLFNTIYEDAVFVARDNVLMPMLVQNFADGVGYADRVVPLWAQAEAKNVADGVDFVTGKKLSKSEKARFTPGEVMAQFLLTDQMMLTNPESAPNAAATELGNAVAEKIDKDLLGLFSTFSNGKGTAGSALKIAHVAAALAVVRTNKGRGRASTVVTAYQWHDIWVELGQPAATQALLGDVANQALRDYAVGRFVGVDWYTSDNITVDSNNAYGAVFVPEAIALDVREQITLRPQRDESLRADELNMHTGYAYGKLWGERGAYLLSDSSEPT